MHASAAQADLVVMAAAVADFRPARRSVDKIKKNGLAPAPIELELNPDVLAELTARRREGQVVVGFAAETGDEATVLRLGQEKARRKGADLLVVNAVGESAGFGDVATSVTLLDGAGTVLATAEGSKAAVAVAVVDAAVRGCSRGWPDAADGAVPTEAGRSTRLGG